ncbi:hypothetical protein BJ878DRAFT_484471 [Calycina marina]|uniref:Uncharacterized protein n=1 Tax=Calycina marina TaxID=1763456 RepID=A0A9P7ZD34_9HELO|nr:hypothetical protein BJ878DRAFT_484471 [Calycina marina]
MSQSYWAIVFTLKCSMYEGLGVDQLLFLLPLIFHVSRLIYTAENLLYHNTMPFRQACRKTLCPDAVGVIILVDIIFFPVPSFVIDRLHCKVAQDIAFAQAILDPREVQFNDVFHLDRDVRFNLGQIRVFGE